MIRKYSTFVQVISGWILFILILISPYNSVGQEVFAPNYIRSYKPWSVNSIVIVPADMSEPLSLVRKALGEIPCRCSDSAIVRLFVDYDEIWLDSGIDSSFYLELYTPCGNYKIDNFDNFDNFSLILLDEKQGLGFDGYTTEAVISENAKKEKIVPYIEECYFIIYKGKVIDFFLIPA